MHFPTIMLALVLVTSPFEDCDCKPDSPRENRIERRQDRREERREDRREGVNEAIDDVTPNR